jgi:hypothetical protein
VKTWVCACTCGLGILMLLRATVRGASSVAGERDRDTWVSLLATPLSGREILRGKWAGCVFGQRDLMFLLAAVWAVGVFTGSVNPLPLIPAAVLLAVYVAAFGWLGVSYSVPAKNSRAAIAKALPTALFLGGGYWLLAGCCCVGLSVGRTRGSEDLFEAVGGFLLGMTPPFVLAGLPALDGEVLRDALKHGRTLFGAMVVGAVCGGLGWRFFGYEWCENSCRAFAADSNRDADDIPVTRRPPPRRATPPDSSDTEDSS